MTAVAPAHPLPVPPPPARDLFAVALQDLPDGIALIEGHDDRIAQVNRAVRQLLGYEPAWLVGGTLGMLLDPVHTSIAERAWRHRLVVEDTDLRRIDGSRSTVQLRARPTTVEGRELVIVTLRDVRERRRAETAAPEHIRERDRRHISDHARGTVHRGQSGSGTYLWIYVARGDGGPPHRYRRTVICRRRPAA